MNDQALLNRPVIVVGAPRSGTTLVGHVLSRHASVCYLEEPRLTWRFGNDGKSDLLDAADARPEVCAHIRATFARQVREAGRDRLLEKTPSNALRLPYVDRVFPDAIYVHILRNGYDSVLSIRKFWQDHAHGVKHIAPGRLRQRLKEVQLSRLPHYGREVARRVAPGFLKPMFGQNIWGPRIPGIEQMVRQMDLLDVCCLQWRTCVELACQFGRKMPPTRYLECRLEDLDVERMEQILAFCDLQDDSAPMDYFRSQFDPTASGARKMQADPEIINRMQRWLEPTMQWLGYDAAPAESDPSAANA